MPSQTQNRRDLLQAYRLMTQRTALALIAGEPDSPNQPLRRRNTATVSGILAGVIVCAVFGVLGLLSPGPVSGLTKPGTLVIDKDTATPYVPCDASGQQKLCPALNYASALLALDTANVNRVDVTQKTLANYPVGPSLGIAGLPQDLPTPADLVKGPWSVCIDGNGVSTLVGGASVTGGVPLTTTTAELVKALGQEWVLYEGARFEIADDTMRELWPQSSPQNVSPAWLNTLPQNPNGFTPPVIPGWGHSVQGPGGAAKAGQVYAVSSAGLGTQYYVLEPDQKLHNVTPVQATLLEHEPGAPGQLSLAAGQATNLGDHVPNPGLPYNKPTIPQFTSPVCASLGTGGSRTITAGGTIPANPTPTGNGSPTTVDRVWLPQDHGALIGVTATDQSRVKAWFLLDGATRYGLAGTAVAGDLGYNLASEETVLPASLVDVLPQGPALDPSQVKQQMSG
jgi:ESX secretion system ATPase EccB